jgi:uncharacterized membrane protein YfcA
VTVTGVLVLAGVGIAGGIISTVASVASVVSYPALLAFGLPPVAANMTNTFALLFTGAGAAAGSRPELAGQGTRIRLLGPVAALGGGAGAGVLLATPAGAFVRAAPVLIGVASLVLFAPPVRPRSAGHEHGADGNVGAAEESGGGGGCAAGEFQAAGELQAASEFHAAGELQAASEFQGAASEVQAAGDVHAAGQVGAPGGTGNGRRRVAVAACFGATVYIGYFGAAGGILLLATLTRLWPDSLVRSNALKNIANGFANTVAAATFALLGHVDWAVVPPLAAGFLAGGWVGPALARRVPARILRIVVGCCGLAIAARLALTAYG